MDRGLLFSSSFGLLALHDYLVDRLYLQIFILLSGLKSRRNRTSALVLVSICRRL